MGAHLFEKGTPRRNMEQIQKQKGKTNKANKAEVKRTIQQVSAKLRNITYAHMIMVGIAVIYWTLLVVYKANQPLDCTDSKDEIRNTVYQNETEKSSKDRLILHPSIDYEHAMSLENMYHCYMINQGCSGYENATTLKINGVLRDCSLDESYLDESDNTTDPSLTAEECDKLCVPEPYRMIENMSHIGLDDYKPVALEWYANIHFWDFLWLITAIFIQIRLSNFRENSGFSGPTVIDEKDMALTSIHILTVFITLAMYAVDVTMNSCRLSLHDHDAVERDHASYWTIYERNVLLLKIHAVYCAILLPILIISFIMREAFQKYETLQFTFEM